MCSPETESQGRPGIINHIKFTAFIVTSEKTGTKGEGMAALKFTNRTKLEPVG